MTFVRQNLEAIRPDEVGTAFEAVFGCSVLHHLDLDTTLPQLAGVLAPGAHLAFSEPNLLNPQVQLMFSRFRWARRKWATSDTEMAFYPWELESIFTRQGFEVLELFPFDFMHPAIPAAVLPVARIARPLAASACRSCAGSAAAASCTRASPRRVVIRSRRSSSSINPLPSNRSLELSRPANSPR